MQELKAPALLSAVRQGCSSDPKAVPLFVRLPSAGEDKSPRSHAARSKSRGSIIKCKGGKGNSDTIVTRGRGGRLETLEEGVATW